MVYPLAEDRRATLPSNAQPRACRSAMDLLTRWPSSFSTLSLRSNTPPSKQTTSAHPKQIEPEPLPMWARAAQIFCHTALATPTVVTVDGLRDLAAPLHAGSEDALRPTWIPRAPALCAGVGGGSARLGVSGGKSVYLGGASKGVAARMFPLSRWLRSGPFLLIPKLRPPGAHVTHKPKVPTNSSKWSSVSSQAVGVEHTLVLVRRLSCDAGHILRCFD